MRSFYEMAVKEFRRLELLPFEDKATYLGQSSQRLVTVIVVRRTAPEGLFVQLYLLGIYATIDHCTHVAVTDR